jgi:hypothetical protein
MKNKDSVLAVSVAFLVVFALLSSGLVFRHVEAVASSVTVGNTDVGSSTYRFGTSKDASRFLVAGNGTMQSVSVYFFNSRFYAKAAIYSDVDGKPSGLVTQSGSERISASGWHTFVLPQNTLTSGYYWLSVVCSSSRASGRVIAGIQAGQHCVRRVSYYGEFRGTFGTPTRVDSVAVSIYGIFVPVAVSGMLLYGVYWDQACSNATSSVIGELWRQVLRGV